MQAVREDIGTVQQDMMTVLKVVVGPPGQFGLLVTRETVHVPTNGITFISIRAGIKFQGLVNVCGFHVDPGYRGQPKFAVYNGGSRSIVLDQDQRVIMIWFADLDQPDDKPYPERTLPARVITADDVARIQGQVASPAELKPSITLPIGCEADGSVFSQARSHGGFNFRLCSRSRNRR